MSADSPLVLAGRVERCILFLRGEKVLLDRDLAALYGASTSSLNRAVQRNLGRFPADFMFQLTREEFANLMFQFGTSSWGGTRKMPRVFTEQGVAMLSSVLRSERAVRVNIEIMRAFVRLRGMLAAHKEPARTHLKNPCSRDARYWDLRRGERRKLGSKDPATTNDEALEPKTRVPLGYRRSRAVRGVARRRRVSWTLSPPRALRPARLRR